MSVCHTEVFGRYKQYKVGKEKIEDDPCPGYLSPSVTDENMNKVVNPIRQYHNVSICAVAETVGLNKELVFTLIIYIIREILNYNFKVKKDY